DGWLASIDVDLSVDAPALTLDVPMGFTDMLARAPEHAMEWRVCTRAIFTTYFDRGYRAVGFVLDREAKKGRYLLEPSRDPSLYSLRSATSGSIRIARRAGTAPASTVRPMTTATTDPYVPGSAAPVSNRKARSIDAEVIAPPTPAAAPIALNRNARATMRTH